MSFISAQRIRDNAAKEMSIVFWFHMRIMMFFLSLRLVVPDYSLTGLLMVMFAAFCNAICLAERFWYIQMQSLVYWNPLCQCCFLVSRLLLMTISVIVSAIWVRICWDLVFVWAGEAVTLIRA